MSAVSQCLLFFLFANRKSINKWLEEKKHLKKDEAGKITTVRSNHKYCAHAGFLNSETGFVRFIRRSAWTLNDVFLCVCTTLLMVIKAVNYKGKIILSLFFYFVLLLHVSSILSCENNIRMEMCLQYYILYFISIHCYKYCVFKHFVIYDHMLIKLFIIINRMFRFCTRMICLFFTVFLFLWF